MLCSITQTIVSTIPSPADDTGLKTQALAVINDNFAAGWDPERGGGIIYFQDAEGYTPREWAATSPRCRR